MKRLGVNARNSGPWVGLSGCNDGALYRRAISLTREDDDSTDIDVPDGRSDPLRTLEEEEQLLLLRWILKEALRQGITVDADSPKFIEWAVAMINERNNLKEKERRGLSS